MLRGVQNGSGEYLLPWEIPLAGMSKDRNGGYLGIYGGAMILNLTGLHILETTPGPLGGGLPSIYQTKNKLT